MIESTYLLYKKHIIESPLLSEGLKLKSEAIYHLTLLYIEKSLLSCGLSLKQIPNMSLPDHKYIQDSCNMLIQYELNYDPSSGVFFLYGYGGTGKTFVWKTLSAAIRSKGEVAINVASIGIAALLISGGRIAHSRFHIPINLNENSFLFYYARTLRDIILPKNSDKPFGCKTIVFGGVFRQILPVIQRGNHLDIVQASLHSSRLWHECTILSLTVGGPNDGEVEVEFPEDVIIPSTADHIHSIVSCIYSSFQNHLDDPSYFEDKAILVPPNEEVDVINDYILELMKNEGKTYLSSDSLCETETEDSFEESVYFLDALNAFKASEIPNHKLILKKGVLVMLLCNIDQTRGLCNGTRLQIVRLGRHVIEARIISGRFFNETTYIPRMKLTPSHKKIPFRFQRRPVFTHDHLYVVVSRVTNKKVLKGIVTGDRKKPTYENATNYAALLDSWETDNS
ncbi:uncharacterized protein LOC111893225 [Lactuca sativa]|uniref:uncharacterized protein LOC111893225 n=1 Tax=Lactuca sativa TaxID=4236 RepID=UPI000CD8D628|nr:uncharacterized protein LOC111893225 [Lactuca sativa]